MSSALEVPKTTATDARPAHKARLRQNAEIAQLRVDVASLEARAALWRRFCGVHEDDDNVYRPCDPTTGGDRAGMRQWFACALTELEARQKVEQQNQRLRQALNEQLQTRTALEQLLTTHTLSSEDMAFLRAVEAQNAHADNNDSGQYEVRCTAEAVALLRRAERLYWRASDVVARVFAATNTHRVFSTSHWEEDAESGASYELTTNTPLPWDVRHIEAFLWQEIERTAHSECCLSSVVASQPHAHTKRLIRTADDTHLSIAFEEMVAGRSLTGVFAIRKFIEPHRTVLVLSARTTVLGTALEIREDGWIMLTALAPPTAGEAGGIVSPRSLMQSHYRNYAEQRDLNAPDELAEFRDFVLAFQIRRMKENKRSMQKHMVGRATGCKSLQAGTDHIRDLGLGCIKCEFEARQKSGRAPALLT